MRYRILPVIFLSFTLVVAFPGVIKRAQAQEKQFNIAQTLSIIDTEAVGGDIVSLTSAEQTLERSKKSYDERMYGVLVDQPVMVYRTLDTIPVTRTGEAYVNVTSMSGPISVGDYVTSSEIPGKGQKAPDLSGYMVGVSLMNFDGSTGVPIEHEGKTYQMGQIKIAIGIGPASPVVIKAAGGVLGTLKQIISALLFNVSIAKDLEKILRYLIAAAVATAITYTGYRAFGVNITKGIEAIGRNPLARMTIQSMIIVNVIMLLLVTLGGILLSLAIVSL